MRAFLRPLHAGFLCLLTLVRFPREHVCSFGLMLRELVAFVQPRNHARVTTQPRILSSLVRVSFSHVFSLVLSCYAVFQCSKKSNVFQRRSKNMSEHHVLYCLVMSCMDIRQDFFFFFYLYNTIYYYYYYCSRNPAGKKQKRRIITK